MTTVYFIRHAESDNAVRDGRIRPLTAKGLADCGLVTEFLADKHIDAVLSSPFKRAIDTVGGFAEKAGLTVIIDEDFREQRSDTGWSGSKWPRSAKNEDFYRFLERQWADFSYTLSDGECLAAVQERNIAALNRALAEYEGKTIVVGTHGTALSTIINYYDGTYGFGDFMSMVGVMPWAVKMTFDGTECGSIQKIDLFKPEGGTP